VVASRYPLSFEASNAMTAVLYRGLLVEEGSIEKAFLAARARLEEQRLGWASLQLYARAADGPDHRPIVARPYRGLLAFQEKHARYFFGRDAEIEEVIRDLSALIAARDAARPRFLIVTGASGTGKSSLVLAGVAPRLKARDPTWVVATMRPHARWEGSIAAALAARAATRSPLLLIVDQFEEVFTGVADPIARELFVRALFKLAGDPSSGVSVIATLRVDFLARCGEIRLRAPELTLEDVAYDEAHRVFARTMKAGDLRKVIDLPAARAGLVLEEGLSAQILKDVGDAQGALPLLEYALDQIWQRRRDRSLTWEAYRALGGVGGALEKRADAILAGLDEVRQRASRRLLVQLVKLDDDASLDRRRRVPLDQLRRGSAEEAAVFEDALQTLTRERLLVMSEPDEERQPGREGRSPIVEVAHEELIRSWGALRGWVSEDRAKLAELQQLDQWVEEGKGVSRYVLEGYRYGYAHAVAKRYSEDVSDAAKELIARSDAAAVERAREGVALALREQAHGRKARRMAVVAGLFGLLAAALVVIALRQRSDLKEARRFEAEAAKRRRNNEGIAEARVLLEQGKRELASRLLLDISKGDSLLWRKPGSLHEWSDLVFECLPTTSRADVAGEPRVLRGHTSEVVSASFSPDGRHVVSASRDGTARIWAVDSAGDPVVLKGHTSEVVSAAFSPDGRHVVTASRDGTARVWAADGEGEPVVLKGHAKEVVSASFSPDSGRVVTASYDGTARIWAADGTGDPKVLKGHTKEVVSASFRPFKPLVVTASHDGTARVWAADGSGEPKVFRGHAKEVVSAAWKPFDAVFVTASLDGSARVWVAESEGNAPTLEGHKGEVLSASFSPDGRRVVTASVDGTARVWDIKRGIYPAAVYHHDMQVVSAAFSPDGLRVVTASADRTARVWEQDRSIVLKGHTRGVVSAAFSPDGKRVVTASEDGTARVWMGISISALEWLLERSTTACLPGIMRERYLGESPRKAAELYDACERSYGREPSPPPR
jgi:WD40 repeat protein